MARNDSSDSDLGIEVVPVRIAFLNQPNLPVAPPILELLLACDCVGRIIIGLEPYELIDAITRAETADRLALMLVRAADKIVCDAVVKRAVLLAGEDVDV